MNGTIVRFCGNVMARVSHSERPFAFDGLLVNLDTEGEHRLTVECGPFMLEAEADRIARALIGQAIHEGFPCKLDADGNGFLIVTSRLPSIHLGAAK